MNICFIDTETSAYKPENGRIVEIAYEICTPWPELEVLTSVDQKIQLFDHDRRKAEPKALAINRYSDEEWATAPTPSMNLWQKLTQPLRLVNLVLCGQNVGFDRDWILSEMRRYDLLDEDAAEPPWGRRFVDVQSYSHIVAEELSLPDFGLHTVYDALGGPPLPPHRAHPDVLRAKFVYSHQRKLSRAGMFVHRP